MTPKERAAMRERHMPSARPVLYPKYGTDHYCLDCGSSYPCDAIRALDALDAAESARAELSDQYLTVCAELRGAYEGPPAEAQVVALVDRVQAEWYNGNMDEGAMDRILSDTPDEWMEQHDAAMRAEGAAQEREDIRAGVRAHVTACAAERRGQYDCIHGIDSATATIVLRLAEWHRAARACEEPS